METCLKGIAEHFPLTEKELRGYSSLGLAYIGDCIFELFVRPTYDLYQEVLRMGTQVEVLEPNYMREEILEMIRLMYNQYTK